MKIEELTGCFDSITPTKEQKEKMLAGILNANEEAPVKIVKLNRYKIASIAAVIAVGIFVMVYSNIGKNIIPQVNNKPIIENKDTSTYAVNGVNENSAQKPITDNIEAADNSGGTVSSAANTSPAMEAGMAVDLHEAYPELSGENLEDAPSVAMLSREDARIASAPEAVPEVYEDAIETDGNSKVKYSAGGGGGGSASGGGAFAEYTNLTITEVMNHQIYSKFMPIIYPDKFNFYNAMEYENRLKVVFKNEAGNYMSISVFKDGEHNFYEQVVTPEKIKNSASDGYTNFAVKCGEYYVVYNIDTYDNSAVYDMIISSAYFNN